MATEQEREDAMMDQLRRSTGQDTGSGAPPAGNDQPPQGRSRRPRSTRTSASPTPPPAPPVPTPPPAVPTSILPPPRRQAPMPRHFLKWFLAMGLTGLGLLLGANLLGFSPAVIRMDKVHVVAPRVGKGHQQPTNSYGNKPWEHRAAPKEDLNLPAPETPRCLPANCLPAPSSQNSEPIGPPVNVSYYAAPQPTQPTAPPQPPAAYQPQPAPQVIVQQAPDQSAQMIANVIASIALAVGLANANRYDAPPSPPVFQPYTYGGPPPGYVTPPPVYNYAPPMMQPYGYSVPPTYGWWHHRHYGWHRW